MRRDCTGLCALCPQIGTISSRFWHDEIEIQTENRQERLKHIDAEENAKTQMETTPRHHRFLSLVIVERVQSGVENKQEELVWCFNEAHLTLFVQ